jgi:tRNA threonylcarbamoyladenosine biosynthesis protein TsaB
MNASESSDKGISLAFETSSGSGSVALGRGVELLGVRRFSRVRAHAMEFAPSIDSLCREHGVQPGAVSRVFVSGGPGSFTGLRIGITAARTLAMALSAKVVAIPTLEVIAQNALDAGPHPARVAVVLDAKRGHIYTACFELRGQHYDCITEAQEADPAKYLADMEPDCAVLGEGVAYHQKSIVATGLRILPENLFPPRVETVFQLGIERARAGAFVAARDLTPLYIRPPEAEEVWAARHGQS